MLPAQLSFQSVPTYGTQRFGELSLRWAEMTHPSGSTAWRFDYRGASFVFSGDCEVRDEIEPCHTALVELAQGADVLLMDAQYFDDEYTQRKGWGHSTLSDAVSVAQSAGVRRLLLTHHDPSHDDERLDLKAELAQRMAPNLNVQNAHDGLVVELPTEQLALAS
jgi:ribonuclease BN (tRNA processing enzyme)